MSYIDVAAWGLPFAEVFGTWSDALAAQSWARLELRRDGGAVMGRLEGNVRSHGVEPTRGVVLIDASIEGDWGETTSVTVWVGGRRRYRHVRWPDDELPAELQIDGTVVATGDDLDERCESALAALRAECGVPLVLDIVGLSGGDMVRCIAGEHPGATAALVTEIVRILIGKAVEHCSIEVHGRVVTCIARDAAHFDWRSLGGVPTLAIEYDAGWRLLRDDQLVAAGDTWSYGCDEDAREDPVIGALFDEALYETREPEPSESPPSDGEPPAGDDIPF